MKSSDTQTGPYRIFFNGSNIQINGGQFVCSDKFNYVTSSPKTALEILYTHVAPGALLDSAERFDAPRCDEDTREVIQQVLVDWIFGGGKTSSSIMWLYGPAGSGKSALAQTIAEKCRQAGVLAACFFFSRNSSTSNRSDGRLLVATLVYQLMSSFPGIQPYIQKYIDNDLGVFSKGIGAQAKNLLVLPANKIRRSLRYFLARLFTRKKRPCLFVVDGLDECDDIQVQCEILDALARAAKDLELPFRFLIASRPEAHICHRFDHGLLNTVPVQRLTLVNDDDTSNDIKTYLYSGFWKIRNTHPLKEYIPSSWPHQNAVETLVNRASGQFIYAATVIKYIQSSKNRPTERLQIILGIAPTPADEAPYAALDALYTHIFSSIEDISRAMQIFSLLVTPSVTDDENESFKTPDMLDELLCFQPGDTQLILGDMLSIVALGDRSTPVKLHHASLNDYLLDPSRSGSLSVNMMHSHALLARGYLRLLQGQYASSGKGRRSFEAHFNSFLYHYDRASLDSVKELVLDLASMDFVKMYQYLLSRFSPNIPEHMESSLSVSDLVTMSTFWRARHLWRSRAMERLLHPFTRIDLPGQDSILNAYMHNIYATYWPIDPIFGRSLTTLLAQPRFQNYIFQICDHADRKSCLRCNQMSPLAAHLSYQLMYAFLLHPMTEANDKWTASEGSDISEKCAQQVYLCLTFVDSIIRAILESHRLWAYASPKEFGRKADNKHRTQHDAYADFFFEAALDCSIILLPYAGCTRPLGMVLDKFSCIEPCRQDYVLKRFSSELDQLNQEIHSYRRRADLAN